MGVGTAIGIGGIAAAGIGAGGAVAASGAQSSAATNAANLQAGEAANSTQEQAREFNIQQQNLAPWLQAGTQGVGALSGLLSTPGQGLLTPWTDTFQAPTTAELNDPNNPLSQGYQFQLQQGEGSINNSAAARGGLLGGNTLTALDQYSQGLASTNYQQAYNNALTQYQQSYNIFQGNQTNEFNRLAALSGLGQTAATSLNQTGQQAAQNVTNINSTAGQQIGNSLQAAGGATASGYAGIANSLTSGINNISQYALLSNLLGSGASGGGTPITGAGQLLNDVWG